MRPKTVIPPCKFCRKRFQRNEHLRRHERTHTNEKPYSCHCGQAFSRSDLLTRHAKLAHATHGTERTTVDDPANSSTACITQDDPSDTGEHARSFHNVASDGRVYHTVPVSNQSMAVEISGALHEPGLNNQNNEAGDDTSTVYHTSDASNAHPNVLESLNSQFETGYQTFDDLDILWNDFNFYTPLPMPASYASNYPMNFVSMSQYGFPELDVAMPINAETVQDDPYESGVMTASESRLHSGQVQYVSDDRNANFNQERVRADHMNTFSTAGAERGVSMPWVLSKEDYRAAGHVLSDYNDILPTDFEFPSRHAMCRYIEGYFSGFHEHLPFIHLPTFNIATEAPELVLAVAAVGARYRFQRQQSHHLYVAARMLTEHQLRYRDGDEVPTSIFSTPGLLSHGLANPDSPVSDKSIPNSRGNSSTYPQASIHRIRERDIKTMQAIILLVALGTWNHRSLIKDAFSLASHLALMLREDKHELDQGPLSESTWREWVRSEGRRRTKLVAFAFLNLHSLAYNITPKIMIREVSEVILPSPESHWRATSETQWVSARDTDPHVRVPLRERLASILADNVEDDRQHPSHLSSFGNYILIHCILQQIFFTRQSTCQSLSLDGHILPSEVLSKFGRILMIWQHHWEATKDSSLDPSAPNGPLSFNSTALFRLAHLRLHSDLGSSLQLDTRDAESITRAFRDSPLLVRSPDALRAALQCVQSLSIPIRIGIEFVARTQTLTWSIIHSLVNLECGLFLCKWLETAASTIAMSEPLREDEKRLIGIVISTLNETDFGAVVRAESAEIRQLKRMEMAILRLWAQTFKGAHVFDIMGTIGQGLDLCAEMLRQELDEC
ncbi:hypothetical protein BU24DRAFT_428332 [Aaosphaeria arxii CBS 175.79]|uniref:C2H2-type domain-containing protein n=1 Tax=Aaosphaeria arxii CBS 175.79 TaxID=1450172 RepID=A0A6A5X8N0_9PLEO|nr:uncharacterized protein BU24DRAFT_428332 [Aaosphaeria arxii CBS 175.79]KAF2009415.1 hypothetical protein BU24DRAFT_428332 [Aaosphaeria arxii CBS 175.79]